MSQRRDDALVEKLLPDFFHKHNPGAAWAHVVSMHMALVGIRSLWPTSVADYQRPECTDVSGHGYDLQSANALGDVDFGCDPNYPLVPIAEFSGAANSYLIRADGGAGNWADILGTESYIRVADRGLTIGGWFYDASLSGALEYLMAKDNGVNRQYRLIKGAGNALVWQVWPGPVTVTSTATLRVGWNHCVGIYDAANQDLHVVLNGGVTSNVGGAPAALVDTIADFTIGADGAGANRFTGYGSLCYLCAAYNQTEKIRAQYHFAGPMFGRQE